MLATIISALLAVYIVFMLGMFFLQRRLMYFPEGVLETPDHHGLSNSQIATITSSGGAEIEIWHVAPSQKGFPTILYFHGNKGHIGDRAPKLQHFAAAGFGVVAPSYRGYGRSKGRPHEGGLYDDAMAALGYALGELKLKATDIMIYGESLGSGVATHTAHGMKQRGEPAGALILEAAYTSVAHRSQELYPYIPAYFLVRDRYLSIKKIHQIGCPLLLFHGERDTVIPVHHGHKLLTTALEPKQGIFFKEVDHTQFDHPTLAGNMVDFARQHGLIEQH